MDTDSQSVEEGLDNVASRLGAIARAITSNAAPGTDATGGHVDSLTEAVMGMTAALVMIANALDRIADKE